MQNKSNWTNKILKIHQLITVKYNQSMYNVLLKVKTRLVYTLSGVITPCVQDFNTIVRSCNTSTTMFNHHVCNYNMKKTPKEAWKTFLECSEIWMIYDMPMYNQWMQSNSELSTIVSEISTLSLYVNYQPHSTYLHSCLMKWFYINKQYCTIAKKLKSVEWVLF